MDHSTCLGSTHLAAPIGVQPRVAIVAVIGPVTILQRFLDVASVIFFLDLSQCIRMALRATLLAVAQWSVYQSIWSSVAFTSGS